MAETDAYNLDRFGAGSRTCAKCEQEWWLDVRYSCAIRGQVYPFALSPEVVTAVLAQEQG